MSFVLISLALALPSPLLSGDFPPIKPNSSSKKSAPPQPPIQHLLTHRRFGFMSWMSSVSFAQPFQKSSADRPHLLNPPPCPHRGEQKVAVISRPLRCNDRSCAASTECHVLFWKESGARAVAATPPLAERAHKSFHLYTAGAGICFKAQCKIKKGEVCKNTCLFNSHTAMSSR